MTIGVSGKSIRFNRFLLAMLSQLLILALLVITNELGYSTNDDTTMLAIVSGGYGTPSPYLVNMHIIIGYLLKWLFTICVSVNWMTVFYIAVYLAAAFLLDLLFIFAKERSFSFWGSIAFVDIAFLIVMSYFSFTVLAYWSAISAFAALTYAAVSKSREGKNILTVFGIIMMALAAMIRGEVMKSLLIVYVALILVELIGGKNWRPVLVAGLALLLMVVSIQSNFWISNHNETQKEFLNWGETRSAALDCAAVPYDPVTFAENGISENQYYSIYNAFYYTYDAVDTEVMQKLIDMNTVSNKYDFDFVSFFQWHFSELKETAYFSMLYRVLFIAAVGCFALFGKQKERVLLLLIWAATLFTEFVFFFIQRPIYRVVMPNYIMAVIMIILCCRLDEEKERRLLAEHISFRKLLLSGMAVLVCFTAFSRTFKNDFIMPWKHAEVPLKVLSYMDDKTSTVFLAGDAAAFDIAVNDSVPYGTVRAPAGAGALSATGRRIVRPILN